MAVVIDLSAARARRRPELDEAVARHPARPIGLVASRAQYDALARVAEAEERAFEDGAPVLHVVT